MGRKGRYTILIPSLDDDYLAEGIASLIACKKYDETVTVINTTKGHEAWREQQLVKKTQKNCNFLEAYLRVLKPLFVF